MAALGTVLLAWWPGSVVVTGAALALFGYGFIAMSGVFIAWGSHLGARCMRAGHRGPVIALTMKQAADAAVMGALVDAVGAASAFAAAAGLLATAVLCVRRDRRAVTPVCGSEEVRRGQARLSATGGATG